MQRQLLLKRLPCPCSRPFDEFVKVEFLNVTQHIVRATLVSLLFCTWKRKCTSYLSFMSRMPLQIHAQASAAQPSQMPDDLTSHPRPPHAGRTGERHAASAPGLDSIAPDRAPIPSGAAQVTCMHASDSFSTPDHSPPQARPISDFAFHGAISVSSISQYVVPKNAWTDGQLGIGTSACIEYQHAMCAPHSLCPSEVYWFEPFPHSLPSCGSLSISECVRTPECELSASLWFQLLCLESIMLNQEH